MRKYALMLGLSMLASGPAMAADPATIDWNRIPAVKVTLFYPGQSSYQWLRSTAHKGRGKLQRGESCVSCHDADDEEKVQGAAILDGHALEPHAASLKGKNGHVELNVQAAFDDRNAYLRFQWATNNRARAGADYPAYRFDGKEWKAYGHHRLQPSVLEGKTPPVYEDRMSIMVDDGKVPGFDKQGCWLTCHDGLRGMPKEPKREEVAANPLLSALKKADVRKFLPASRTDPMDWKTGKSLDEIARLKAAGEFLDLIQWRAHRTNPVGGVDDGYVLEYRNFDAGKNHFASNMDGATKMPKFMFDAAKFGAKALAAGDYGKREAVLIKGVNAVPFDANAGWKEGDILPQYVLSAAEAAGSAADNKGIGVWKDGMWTVVVIRPLGLTNSDDKAFRAGNVYNVGFAVHDDNMTARGHHVSYVKTLGFGVKADIQAVKLP